GPQHAAAGGVRARPAARPGLPPGPRAPSRAVLPRLRRRRADLELARADRLLPVAAVRAAAGPGGGGIHPRRAARPGIAAAAALARRDRRAAAARRAGALELRRQLPVPP